MKSNIILTYIKNVITNIPNDWLNLTTHRLDIYNEKLAKAEFLEQFDILFKNNNTSSLNELPTAYDYIRLGHPLSCVLEWTIAKLNAINPNNIISFSSKTMPILAILRKNLLDNKQTQIIYIDKLPDFFDIDILKSVYNYNIELKKVKSIKEASAFKGSTIFISQQNDISSFENNPNIDFQVNLNDTIGSVIIINGEKNEHYISEIQHVRRRASIAMTPNDCLIALQQIIKQPSIEKENNFEANKSIVINTIREITNSSSPVIVGSCGLSIQYAIVMGLIHNAIENHKGKAIKIIVPTNCYGGTNDQARRIANCIDNVAIVDLAVDGDNDMVKSIDMILDKIATENAIPYIIAEIPTNPRVEVPDLLKLKDVLTRPRKTNTGKTAILPVFILDQTFCPNVHFLGENEILSSVKTITYVSGSKFPSGGKSTSGYCLANSKAVHLMEKINLHLKICDNEATPFQMETLAKQLPSMNKRINDAYNNTRNFVSFIKEVLPEAKINFVSEDLASQGFTPSVFSLDLPTKGNTNQEKETYKRVLNHKLINLMITKIPNESKHCVSYGQLNGSYWTIPATSTQGTTKEGDKDYIVRVALSPNMNLELHKKVFLTFANEINY